MQRWWLEYHDDEGDADQTLERDDPVLQCRFFAARGVRCDNGDGYALEVTPFRDRVLPAGRWNLVRAVVLALLAVSGGAALSGAAVAEPVGEDETSGEVVLARESRGFGVDAYNGYVLWSSWDGERRRYRLVARRHGRTVTLPIRPSTSLLDASLGPDRRGQTVAVYSRCRSRGCDLYQFRFKTGRETLLRRVSSPSTSEFSPTIWRDRLAFLRRSSGRNGSVGIYIAGPGRSLRKVRGGTQGQGSTGVTQLKLRGSRLAFSWTTQVKQCPGVPSDPDAKMDPDPSERTEIFVVDGNRRRRLDAGCERSTIRYVGSATNGAKGVGYVRVRDAADPAEPPAQEYTRVQPTIGERSSRPLQFDFDPFSVADDGMSVYTVEDRASDRDAKRWVLVRRPTAP